MVEVEVVNVCQEWSQRSKSKREQHVKSGQSPEVVKSGQWSESGQKWLIVVNGQKATVVTAVKVQRGTIVQRGSQWQ